MTLNVFVDQYHHYEMFCVNEWQTSLFFLAETSLGHFQAPTTGFSELKNFHGKI